MACFSAEERPWWATAANAAERNNIQELLAERLGGAKRAVLEQKLEGERLGCHGRAGCGAGHRHPLIARSRKFVDIFPALAIGSRGTRKVESDHYNFTALNIPPDHPAAGHAGHVLICLSRPCLRTHNLTG